MNCPGCGKPAELTTEWAVPHQRGEPRPELGMTRLHAHRADEGECMRYLGKGWCAWSETKPAEGDQPH